MIKCNLPAKLCQPKLSCHGFHSPRLWWEAYEGTYREGRDGKETWPKAHQGPTPHQGIPFPKAISFYDLLIFACYNKL